MCRMPYTLRNADGQVIEKDKYLLSLRDFNASPHLEEMLEAGASSFKIEGRLKDVDYVRNVTAYYRKAIDEIIARNPDRYVRSSFGESVINYTPRLDKSFNRGFTDYFLGSRRPGRMASLLTPKSMGEEITDISMLHNGDGISFFNARGEYEGVNVNGVRNGRIIGSRPFELPKGAVIHRTNDIEWNKLMSGRTSERKLWVDMTIDEDNLRLTDERGLTATVSLLGVAKDKAQKPMQPERVLGKLGATVYHLRNLENRLNPDTFIPASVLTELRRKGTDMLNRLNIETYPFDRRRPEDKTAVYPDRKLDARATLRM